MSQTTAEEECSRTQDSLDKAQILLGQTVLEGGRGINKDRAGALTMRVPGSPLKDCEFYQKCNGKPLKKPLKVEDQTVHIGK